MVKTGNIPTLIDAIISLALTDNQTTKKRFLGENGKLGMNVQNLLDWHERESKIKLSNEAKEKAEIGFETIEADNNFKLCKVVGDNAQKKLAFQSIGTDLPGNCLGRSHTEYYLQKPDTQILVLKEKGTNKNLVAIEFNTKNKSIQQIEGNKPKGEGRVPANSPYTLSLVTFLINLVRKGELKTINGINHLEDEGVFRGKVITTSGEIKNKGEVPEEDILFPTPIFGKPENLKLPLTKFQEKLTLTEAKFFTGREPKKKGLIQREYTEAGVYIYSNPTEHCKVEKPTTTINQVKHMDLNKTAYDNQICARLGIEVGQNGEILPTTDQSKLWTIQEIQTLLEQQMYIFNNEIKTGDLKTDDYANIFYVKSKDGKQVRSVYLLWDASGRKWGVGADRFGQSWLGGRRAFSRN